MTDRRHHPWWVKLLVMLVSPVAEKNPVKTLASVAPVVFSMSRITVAVFTYVDAVRIAHAPTIGWPEATLALGNIFALPLLAALGKVSPSEVLAFGEKIVGRFGVGEVAQPPFPGMDRHEDGP